MVKSLRFLLQFIWVNLAVVLGFAAVLTAGVTLTGAGNGGDGPLARLSAQYYELFPLMLILIAFLLSVGLCTSNLDMALSFGARRRDYFWAVQGAAAVYTLAYWAMQAAMTALPALLGWEKAAEWEVMMNLGGAPFWVYPLVAMTVLTAGCAMGPLFIKSRVWGAILMAASMVVGTGTVVLLLFVSNHMETGLWGDLPVILAVIMVVIFLVSEWFIWRAVRRAVVK